MPTPQTRTVTLAALLAFASVSCGGEPPAATPQPSAESHPDAPPAASASSAAVGVAPSAVPSVAAAPLDSDKDGVPDARDVCPMEPGPDDPNPAWAGCPMDAPPRPHPQADMQLVFDFGPQPRALTEPERTKVLEAARTYAGQPKVTLLVQSPGAANATAWGKLLRDYFVSGGIQEPAITVRPCVSKAAKVRSVFAVGDVQCEAIKP